METPPADLVLDQKTLLYAGGVLFLILLL